MDAKREWLQLHLSTAIVLMISASGFLWLNFSYGGQRSYLAGYWLDGAMAIPKYPKYFVRGWPAEFIKVDQTYLPRGILNTPASDLSFPIEIPRADYFCFGIDVFVAVVTIAGIGTILEWHIRRAERLNNRTANRRLRA